MSTRLLRPQITVEIDGDDFTVSDGTRVVLDSWAVPYAQATVELPLLDEPTLDYLDWRAGAVRVPVSAGTVGATPRVFDLGVRGRRVDHTRKTVTVDLAGDEALLQDYTALSEDRTCLGLASSLRDVIDYVLGTVISGASLVAGSDADVTPVWSVTNMPGNSGFEGGSTAGYGGSNVSNMVITTAAGFFKSGTRAMRYESTAAGTSRLDVGLSSATFRCTPGRSYTAAAWHRSAGPRAGAIGLRFYDGDGGLLYASSSAFDSPQGPMVQAVHTARAPAGAATVWPYIATAGNGAGTLHYVDDVMLVEGEFLPDWFSGDTTDTATYEYAWAAGANASQSIRTALIDGVTPDALIWRAGVSAWEFLLPLCAAAGMVLWCDEQRAWRLQTPEQRTVSTVIAVSASTSRSGTDDLSRDDTDMFATGVACRYRWTDRDGIQQERVDATGSPEKALVVDFTQPYPGPGMAANILARRQGTGRVQDVTVFTRWDAAPGMTANVTLPGAPETSGRVSKVTFHPDGFMDLGMSGLVDIIPDSIAALTGTIGGLAGTIGGL